MNLKSIFKTSTSNWPEYYKSQQSKAKDERLRQFYQRGLVDPKTPLSQVPFVAVDFETTGLDPKKDGIISIGLVPFTLNRIQLSRATHWIVNPDRPLDEESVVIHGITHSDIIDAPDLTNILEGLLEALAGTVVVVHYRKIEREFLDLALKSRIGEGILFPVIDTLELEAKVQRKQSSGLMNILKGKKTRIGTPGKQSHPLRASSLLPSPCSDRCHCNS
jgi:DNA polymerase-3 subunit epsilon